MILAELRNYLCERGQASLQDLALHFDTAPDALREREEQGLGQSEKEDGLER